MTSALFFADIIINFNTAFYLTNGKLEVKRFEINKNYVLSGWLIVDFISCFGFSSLEISDDEIFLMSKVFYMFRLTKLAGTFKRAL
jgi:hypothetical protein